MSSVQKSVLFMLSVWPEPTSTATGIRTRDLVEICLRQGWTVTCACAAPENEFTEALRARGVACQVWPPNDARFDTWVAELAPTYAFFDRFYLEEQFGWRVEARSPATVRIVDTQDLHFLRHARERALKAGTPLEKITTDEVILLDSGAKSDQGAERELSSIFRSDLTLICSRYEEELLVTRFRVPRELVVRAPLFLPIPSPSRAFDERAGFCAIGNLRHPPNADAFRWLHQLIWPEVRRRLPTATLDAWGAYIPREIQALHNPETGFRVRGHAKDQYETLARYRVNLAPVRAGAGIKGKIADGWWAGTPCVTTPVGAEGMSASRPFAGLVETDPARFAQAAARLHEDSALWQRASREGTDAIREIFTLEANESRLLEALRHALEAREERRSRNVTGLLLRYGLHRGTEYFGRWIELKTQLKKTSSAESRP